VSTEILRPSANGSTIENTPSGEASNYACVDEASPDGDTTYVFSLAQTGGGGKKDTYTLTDSAIGTGTINSVTVFALCCHTPNATGSIKLVVRVNGVDYDNGSWIDVPTSVYTDYSYAWTVSPDTSAPWTWSEINALEAGLIAASATGTRRLRCTQVFIVVDYTEAAGSSQPSRSAHQFRLRRN